MATANSKANIGPTSRLYICGHNVYDNELAMYRHEGMGRVGDYTIETVLGPRPRFAYRISEGRSERFTIDPVEVCHVHRRRPHATVDLVAVRR